jgi:hypothetical protein
MPLPKCQFCKRDLKHSFCDLGKTPISNAFLKADDLQKMEPFYPLHAYVCASCLLVQLQQFQTPEQIFSDYAYFSSYSQTWLEHAKKYTEEMTARFQLSSQSTVIEIASNDGYLLQNFVQKSIPCLGIEPAFNVAEIARKKGVPTISKFFGVQTAKELLQEKTQADLLLGNNVLAHVPDLMDFVGGMKIVLKDHGIITMEFPHLLNLMENNQFDTIYHEHFSYLSLLAVQKIFSHFELELFDVEELLTHGGSLRIYVKHKTDGTKEISKRVNQILEKEKEQGFEQMKTYEGFEQKVRETKRILLDYLIQAKEIGKKIVGYGAPAKGNTLLNFCGIRKDFIDYTVDMSPFKQGCFLPGTHIPIFHPDKIRETKPDYVLILPWNLKEEIISQLSYIRSWGGKFLVPIPSLEVVE